jgi:hypothetical protein
MWNQPLVRELAVILLIKLAALYLIWFAFFSAHDERTLTPQEMGVYLLGESRAPIAPHQPNDKQGVRDGH